MGFRRPTLVFDRIGLPHSAVAAQFDDIGDTGYPKGEGADWHRRDHPRIAASIVPGLLAALVEDPPFGSEQILRPQALHMDQRALPRAVEVVLERREGDEIVLCSQIGNRGRHSRT